MSLDEALAEARHRYVVGHPRSAALADRARRFMPGGNTRSVLHVEPFAVRVARAEGAYLCDVDGNRYLDLLGDYSAGLLGHHPAPVATAVRARLDDGWALGAMAEAEITFAEAVVSRFPSVEQVRFTNSGTEANLMAIMTARHASGRDRVVVFGGAYHGGLLSFGPGGAGVRAPFDYTVLPYNDAGAVERELATHGDRVACVLVEPLLGASGCIPGTRSFLEAVRSATRDAGAVLVFDEVMTSRLSIGGAQGLLGLTPDMTTLGKYLAGGLTFGAFGGSRDLMAAFDPHGGGLAHGGTFNNNAFTMAAGTVVHDIVTADGWLDALTARGDALRRRLAEVFAASSVPFSVTGWGSLCAVHPVRGHVASPADLAVADERWRMLFFHDMLEAGFYLAPRGYIALSAAITDGDLDRFVDAVATFCARRGGAG